MRDAADQIRTEVVNMMGDVERLRDRVSKLGAHFDQVGEDVRQVLISVNKIGKRAARIEELDFSPQAPSEPSAPAAPELFPVPRAPQLQSRG